MDKIITFGGGAKVFVSRVRFAGINSQGDGAVVLQDVSPNPVIQLFCKSQCDLVQHSLRWHQLPVRWCSGAAARKSATSTHPPTPPSPSFLRTATCLFQHSFAGINS